MFNFQCRPNFKFLFFFQNTDRFFFAQYKKKYVFHRIFNNAFDSVSLLMYSYLVCMLISEVDCYLRFFFEDYSGIFICYFQIKTIKLSIFLFFQAKLFFFLQQKLFFPFSANRPNNLLFQPPRSLPPVMNLKTTQKNDKNFSNTSLVIKLFRVRELNNPLNAWLHSSKKK